MKSRVTSAAAVLAVLLTSTACTVVREETSKDPAPQRETQSGAPADPTVTLVTHDSFSLPKKLLRQFTKDTGYELQLRASGDAGTLTNKLVLTQGNPTGDVAFGVDNTFASRALDEDVFAEHDVELPAGADSYTLPGGEDRLVPVDNANVCVNVDTTWFDQEGIEPPQTFDDLTKSEYEGLFVTPGAATSSPGMAFLLATIATYEDGWTDYWADLMANGTKLTSGWSDAYYVDFTLGGEKGDRPIVLSYDSSPAFTLTEDGTETTSAALLDTCFRQVEYAGVLTGTDNPDGARAALEFLLSEDVQAELPTSMYVFPVRDDVELPEDWASFATQPDEPLSLDPSEITAQREQWLTEWTDITSR